MRVYLIINSDILSPDVIMSEIKYKKPTNIVQIGDKSKYNSYSSFNSCEYHFGEDYNFIEEVNNEIKYFLMSNQDGISKLRQLDGDLYVSLRFILYLDGEVTPDTFFDTDIIVLLAQCKATLDIDMYYKE